MRTQNRKLMKVVIGILIVATIFFIIKFNEPGKLDEFIEIWKTKDLEKIEKELGIQFNDYQEYLYLLEELDIKEEIINKIDSLIWKNNLKVVKESKIIPCDELKVKIYYIDQEELLSQLKKSKNNGEKAGIDRATQQKRYQEIVSNFSRPKEEIVTLKSEELLNVSDYIKTNPEYQEDVEKMISLLKGNLPTRQVDLTVTTPIDKIKELWGRYDELKEVDSQDGQIDKGIRDQILSEERRKLINDINTLEKDQDYIDSGTEFRGSSYEHPDNFIINP